MNKLFTSILVPIILLCCSCTVSSKYPGTYAATKCTTKSGAMVPCNVSLTLDDKSHFTLHTGDKEMKGQWEVFDNTGHTILNLKREDKYENIELTVANENGKNTFKTLSAFQLMLPDSIQLIELK